MSSKKRRRTIIIVLVAVILFFIGYSFFYRSFIDTDRYLQVAWEYTGRDPHILAWREPESEVLFENGELLVHFVYHTDQDREIGPYSFYIDPFQMKVVKEDPRVPTGN